MIDFDLHHLPSGLTVLEASAGTGKTSVMASLAVRYLADGVVTAPHLLAITFTHLASADLRSRLYTRLLQAADALSSMIDGHPVAPDKLWDILAEGGSDAMTARLARLQTAINDFDAATVATIHEFCRRAADWLGPLLPGTTPNQDDDAAAAIGAQVIADSTLSRQLADVCLSVDDCHALGRAALDHPDLPVEPAGTAADFVTAVRAEYDRRKQVAGVNDYSDLARRLNAALLGPGGALVAESLAERYHVVLVDEFQDTDPVQWSILRRAFAGRRPLVLVGDPKQSIYGFRGADVFAYLEAVSQAEATHTLPVNYRSDEAVVAGINALFEAADFGVPGGSIPMRASAPARTGSRLQGLDPGLEVRRIAPGRPQREAIDHDIVAWVVHALGERVQIERPHWRTLRADDIAVLVSSNRHGDGLSQALQQAGVPAVFSGVASVFASVAAEQWLVLLDTLANPHPRSLPAAMSGQLIGLSLAELAEAGSERTVFWAAVLRQWSGGVAPGAILDQLEATADLSPRLLGRPGGERLLTDVRHLAELLAGRGDSDPAGLAAWLRAQRRRAVGDRTRRLETDRPAVTVMTVHAAKGLEFPVALVPASADAPRQTWTPDYPMVVRRAGRRVLDAAGGGPGSVDRLRLWAEEQAAEDRRRLYVALTRASSLAVAWLGDRQAALAQLLEQHATLSPAIRVVDVRPVSPLLGRESGAPPPLMGINTFEASIDADWTRTSYSGLTADLHGAFQDSDEADLTGDEVVPNGQGPVSPMDGLPVGAAFGSVVHAVLEVCDPASPTLRSDLVTAASRLCRSSSLPDLDVEHLSDALVAMLNTPLGSWAGDVTLASLGSARRLAELSFELPLGSGPDSFPVAALARLFGDPRLVPPDDLLAGYGDQLLASTAAPRQLRGFLTGSIDAIHELADGRLVLFDYKTNRLGPPEGPDPLSGYGRAAMARAMMAANYPLQALLYAVALRRYLAWRRPSAEFDDQWAGVAYLFVRGMAGAGTPLNDGLPTGVYAWRPSPELIQAADGVLAGGVA